MKVVYTDNFTMGIIMDALIQFLGIDQYHKYFLKVACRWHFYL